METFFPHNLPENRIQADMIRRMAVKMGVGEELLAPHWIDLYSPIFREKWEAGERDPDTLARLIYTPDPLGSNWADSVASILIGERDPQLIS